MARIVAHIFTRAEILPRLRAAIPDLAFPVQSMNAKNPDGEWIKPTDGNVLKWASIEDLAFSLADLLTIGYQAFQLQFESAMGRGEVTRTLHADELTQDAKVEQPAVPSLEEIRRRTELNPARVCSTVEAALRPLTAQEHAVRDFRHIVGTLISENESRVVDLQYALYGARRSYQFIERAVASFDPELLAELRAEISRVNRAAGETVFNPALTQCLDAAIREARGQ